MKSHNTFCYLISVQCFSVFCFFLEETYFALKYLDLEDLEDYDIHVKALLLHLLDYQIIL